MANEDKRGAASLKADDRNTRATRKVMIMARDFKDSTTRLSCAFMELATGHTICLSLELCPQPMRHRAGGIFVCMGQLSR